MFKGEILFLRYQSVWNFKKNLKFIVSKISKDLKFLKKYIENILEILKWIQFLNDVWKTRKIHFVNLKFNKEVENFTGASKIKRLF